MVEAVRKTKQIVQIGMQRRSAPAVIKAKEMVDSGDSGQITMAKPMWNWNVSRALDNSPLPGKLDWKRFPRAGQGSRSGADAVPPVALLLDYSGGQYDRSGHPLMT
jgi:predicted dehydrogenase